MQRALVSWVSKYDLAKTITLNVFLTSLNTNPDLRVLLQAAHLVQKTREMRTFADAKKDKKRE